MRAFVKYIIFAAMFLLATLLSITLALHFADKYNKEKVKEVGRVLETRTYVFLKQGCQQKVITKEESQLWGSFSSDKKWIFMVPQVCEGSYALMSSEEAKIVGTVSFVDGGIIIELENLRIGIK